MTRTFTIAAAVLAAVSSASQTATFVVRAFGSRGDGQTIDSDAINKAIDAAAASGGGFLDLPAGVRKSVAAGRID